MRRLGTMRRGCRVRVLRTLELSLVLARTACSSRESLVPSRLSSTPELTSLPSSQYLHSQRRHQDFQPARLRLGASNSAPSRARER